MGILTVGMDQSPAEIWNHVSLQVKLTIAANCVFPLLSLFGALFAYREENEAVPALALVLLFFPLVFYITHSSSLLRYRHPMDPVMLVLAVYGLAYPVNYVLRHSRLETRIPATDTTDQGSARIFAISFGQAVCFGNMARQFLAEILTRKSGAI